MLSKRLFLSSVVLLVLASFLFVDSVDASSMMWSRTYGGAGQEVAYAVVETSDGGYALAGYTGFWSITDVWVVKTDKYGNMEWNQKYGEGVARALVESSDGGYTLAGNNRLIKTDAYGNMEWNRTYGAETVNSVIKTTDGGYALAGTKHNDFWLAKTEEHGVIPEFPSGAILPLLLVATSVAVICKKRLPKNQSNQQKPFILGD